MIYSIKGTIVVLQEGTLCIENNGMTWELGISLHSFQSLSAIMQASKMPESTKQTSTKQESTQSDISQTSVYTYLHANDKGMHLYGFYSLAERSVFLTLLKVSGIGPKAAIKILSHTTPELLMGFIKNQDTKALSKISGIGAKKASAILLALEGVYISSQSLVTKDGEQATSKEMGAYADIINGLIKMGYDKYAIDNEVEQMKKEGVDMDTIDEGILMHTIIKRLEA